MSELMVVAYTDRDRAIQVIEDLCRIDTSWIELNDTIAVVRDKKGQLRVPDQRGAHGRVVAWGALWRRLLQTSMSTGEWASGSTAHRTGVAGIPDAFLRATSELLARGDSALIILLRVSPSAMVCECLSASSTDVLRLPLSNAQDALLYSVLDVHGPERSERATHVN